MIDYNEIDWMSARLVYAEGCNSLITAASVDTMNEPSFCNSWNDNE